MLKKIIISLLVLLILCAATLFFAGSFLVNKAVHTGIETIGPHVTQTSVSLDDVNISALSGKGSLSGLKVGNPEGFKNEFILELGQIEVELRTSSLLSDKIIIEKVHIQNPAISYEKTLTSSNLDQLLKNIEAFTGTEEKKDTDSASGKKVVIRELLIEGGTIYAGTFGAGVRMPMPTIRMENVGEQDDGQTPAQVIQLVLTEVFKSSGSAVSGASEFLKESGKGLLDGSKKATDGIRNLFGR